MNNVHYATPLGTEEPEDDTKKKRKRKADGTVDETPEQKLSEQWGGFERDDFGDWGGGRGGFFGREF